MKVKRIYVYLVRRSTERVDITGSKMCKKINLEEMGVNIKGEK